MTPGKYDHLTPSTQPLCLPGHASNIAIARQKIGTLIAMVLPHMDGRSAKLVGVLGHQIAEMLRITEEGLVSAPFADLAAELDAAARVVCRADDPSTDAPTGAPSPFPSAEQIQSAYVERQPLHVCKVLPLKAAGAASPNGPQEKP